MAVAEISLRACDVRGSQVKRSPRALERVGAVAPRLFVPEILLLQGSGYRNAGGHLASIWEA